MGAFVMMTLRGLTLREICLPLVLLLQVGCITARTLERGKPHGSDYASITRVTKASVTSTELFIEFQARPLSGRTDEPRVLRIPFNTSAWLHDKRGKPVFPSD